MGAPIQTISLSFSYPAPSYVGQLWVSSRLYSLWS
jgi:hypothetical protein